MDRLHGDGGLTAPALVRSGYVDTDLGQIHYRCSGTSGPHVVLFHESPLSSLIFERALPLLGTGLRAWAFDTPGYGASTAPEKALEIPEYARRLLMAVHALGIDRFAVAGTHTGASIALEAALQVGPDQVSVAVFSGLPLLTPEERARFLADWAPPIHVDPDGELLSWAWQRYARIWPGAPPELLLLGATQVLTNHARWNWAYNAAFRYDPARTLPALRARVLLLNAQDDILAHTDARVLELLPEASLQVVPGIGGQIPWRRPEQYSRVLTDLLTGGAA